MMQRLYIPVTKEISLYTGSIGDTGTVMCRIFSKQELLILRAFMATHKDLRPLLKALREDAMSEEFVLRYQGKTFILYAINKEIRMRGAQHDDNRILTHWNALVGEYWFPELIKYLTNNQ